MSQEDTEDLADVQDDITKTINAAKSAWVMNGVTDDQWEDFKDDLEAYGLSEALEIYQKYLDAYYAE